MSVLDWIVYIFIAIAALLFMIMIHELGHYTAGKLLKFKINEFSIGFGKSIFTKTKKNGEVFSLRAIPLGGYCAFDGEDEDKPQSEGSFNSQKPWKRLIVLFMGAFFNFLSALVFSAIFLMSYGYADRVQINSVRLPQGLESESWLQKGDVVLAVDGTYTNLVYDYYFQTLVAGYDVGETFVVTVLRDGKEINLNIQKSLWDISSQQNETFGKVYSLDDKNYNLAIVYNENDGKYELVQFDTTNNNIILNTFQIDTSGKVSVDNQTIYVNIPETSPSDISTFTLQTSNIGVTTTYYKYSFFEALGQTFIFCFQWAYKILIILWQLITGQLALTSLGGTVTTVVTIAEATQMNFANLLLLIPLISINLAVFNLLPFPALDGARMVFVGIEWVRGKPINRKVEGTIHFVGLIILFAFVVLVDILHFVL